MPRAMSHIQRPIPIGHASKGSISRRFSMVTPSGFAFATTNCSRAFSLRTPFPQHHGELAATGWRFGYRACARLGECGDRVLEPFVGVPETALVLGEEKRRLE